MSFTKALLILPMVTLLIGCSRGGSTTSNDPKKVNTSVNISVDELIAINIANQKALPLKGTCLAPGGNIHFYFTDNRGNTLSNKGNPLTCSEEKKWSTDIDTRVLREGDVQIEVTHEDLEGNTYQYEKEIVKDLQVPAAPTIASTVEGIGLQSNNQYILEGTCKEDGLEIEVALKDTAQEVNTAAPKTPVICKQGRWRAKVGVGHLLDGQVNIHIALKDQAGNPAPKSDIKAISKDSVEAWVTVDSPNSIFGDASAAVSYQVQGRCSEDGKGVRVTIGGEEQTGTCSNGGWSATFRTLGNLSHGETPSLDIGHGDSVGNTATFASQTVKRSISATRFTINSLSPFKHNDSAYNLSGTCAPDAQNISLTVGDVAANTTPICREGAWSASFVLSSKADGALEVRGTYSGESIEGSIVKDTVPPEVTVMGGEYISMANEEHYVLSGECSEHGQQVSLSFTAGGNTVVLDSLDFFPLCINGKWQRGLDTTQLNDGALSIVATQRDSVGNGFSTSALNVMKDASVSEVAINSDLNPITSAHAAEGYTVRGSCNKAQDRVFLKMTDGVNVVSPKEAQLVCDGSAWEGNFDVSTLLRDGDVTILARIEDNAGNRSEEVTHGVVKDTLPPVVFEIASDLSVISNFNENRYPVRGTCSEVAQAVGVSLTDGASPPQSTSLVKGTCSSDKAWLVYIDTRALKGGSVTINATHYDLYENRVVKEASITKDLNALAVSITTPGPMDTHLLTSGLTAYTVSGGCSKNGGEVTIAVTDGKGGDQIPGTNEMTCANKSWSFSLGDLSEYPEGEVTFEVTHTDSASSSSVSTIRRLKKDTVLPHILTVSNPRAISSGQMTTYTLNGTCSENGRDVVVTLTNMPSQSDDSVSSRSTCSNGQWKTAGMDTTGLEDGEVNIALEHGDLSGNLKSISQGVIKNSTPSAVSITKPSATDRLIPLVNLDNLSVYVIQGSCSQNGRTLSVELSNGYETSIKETPTCSSGSWSITVNIDSWREGRIIIDATETSNINEQASTRKIIIKDTSAPMFTLAKDPPPRISPSTGETYNLGGTCSDDRDIVSVTLSDGNTTRDVTGQDTCDGGTWSVALAYRGLEDGSIDITMNIADELTRKSAAVSRAIFKRVAPVEVSISDPTGTAYINSNEVKSYRIEGACSHKNEDVRVALTDQNGLKVIATTTCEAGRWGVDVDAHTLVEGDVAIAATQLNNTPGDNTRVTKDTVAPVLTLEDLSLINGSATLGSYQVGGTCDIGGEEIRLSLTDGAGLTITPSSSVNCPSSGQGVRSWTAEFDVRRLAEGNVAVRVSYEDAAGNEKVATPVTGLKDTQSPTLTIQTPNTIYSSNAGTYSLRGTCSETGQRVVVKITRDGTGGANSLTPTAPNCVANSQGAGGTWTLSSFNTQTLSYGAISITVSQVDTVQNRGEATARTTKVDTNLGITITSTPNINAANVGSYSLTGACAPIGGTVRVTVGGVSPNNGGSTLSSLPCDGTWTGDFSFSGVGDSSSVAIVAFYTQGGNTVDYPGATVIKDTAIPAITLSSLEAQITRLNHTAYAIGGACDDVALTVNISATDTTNTVTDTATCVLHSNDTDKVWTKIINVETLEAGTVTIKVSQTDIAGNKGTSSQRIQRTNSVIITLASNLATIDNSNTPSYSVSGNCSEHGKSVSVSFKDSVDPANVSITKKATCTGGTWGINDINLFELYNGTITISVEHSKNTASITTVSKGGCTASPDPTDANGHGSAKNNPIVICDYAGLKAMATHGLDKHYALGAHINAQGSWTEGVENCTAYDGTTVPSNATACNGWGLGNLTGSLDGRGFQIRKLYRRKEAGRGNFGLFDSLASGATLENVHLRSVQIHSAGTPLNQGGLVGEAAGTIKYCSVSGVLSNKHPSGSAWSRLGGLAGHLNGGVIEFSKVFDFEILESNDPNDPYRSGGLVGELSGGRIASSYVKNSKLHSRYEAGGLVGYSSGTSTIENSYTLDTTVKGYRCGGLVGGSNSVLEIMGSYVKNTTVQGDYQAGGMLGHQLGTALIINSFVKSAEVSGGNWAGGIVGRGATRIYSSYVDSTSSVSGASAGGLVGHSSTGGGIFHSYSHAPVQGSSTIGSVAGEILQTEINQSYGVGSLSATSESAPNIGGLVGSSQSSHIYHSFWDTETTSQTNSAAGGPSGHAEGYTGPGFALGTSDIKTGCAAGATTGICALGNAFVYDQGSYPKLRKCVANCSDSNPLSHAYGETLLDGQDESLY